MSNRYGTAWAAAWPLLLLALVALAVSALGDEHTWDVELGEGDFDSTVWDDTDLAVTLAGRESLWKWRGGPVLSKGAANAFDDEAVYEPCVLFAKGKWHMYYVGYSGDDYAIGLATSTDGSSWSKSGSNPVLSKGSSGAPDASEVRDPFVLFEDGTFKMWYTGMNGGVSSICYATSATGTSWAKYASNPVITRPSSGWGSSTIGDPCVLKVDTTYYMYLSGAATANEELVGFATSSDGISWTLSSSNPIIQKAPSGEFGRQEIKDVAVVRDGATFCMYFSGRNTAGEKYKIGGAWSSNGVKWARSPKIELDLSGSDWDSTQMESPSAVWADDCLLLYYEGDAGGGTPNHQIGFAQLKPWPIKKASNPTIGTGSDYDYQDLTHPTIVKEPSAGAYYIFYGANKGSGSPQYTIAQASSSTVTGPWSKYASNPVLLPGSATTWDDERVQYPCVIYENGTYKMWYAGFDGSKWEIGYATSTATGGAGSWSKSGSNPIFKVGATGTWDSANVKMPWVLRVGTTYHMWYVGDAAAGGTHIGHATSTNGISWTRDLADPVMRTDPSIGWEATRVEQPSVLMLNDRYLMLYTGVKSSNYEIGMAWSDDGVKWTRDIANPLIPRGNSTAPDDEGTSGACTYVEGSFMHVYFGIYNGSSWQLGYARWYSDGKGTYTTPPLDASALWPVHWNALSWDAELPVATSVRFQVATNRGGTVWNFVGPDGTPGTYYTQSGQALFPYQSGGRMRVRAYLTTDDETKWLPLLRSIAVSYAHRSFGPPEVRVTSPNGGEDWMKTKTYPITWVATGNLNETSVELAYSTDNGTSWTSVATRQPNSGLYKWTVPSTETSGALVRVTVTDVDRETSSDTSDATFAIDPPAPKTGAFLSPSEGDVLAPGDHEAEWTIDDPWGLADRPLTLELTTDGSVSWQLLADALPLSGAHEWQVPALPTSSASCALRLSVLGWLGDISVIESGIFTIDVSVPTVIIEALPGPVFAGEPMVVTASVDDDLGAKVVTLHIAASDDTRERTTTMVRDGVVWRATFTPSKSDSVMWVVASDGVNEGRSADVPIEVRSTGGASGQGGSLALELAAAALLAGVVTAAVAALRWRGRTR